MLTTGLLYNSKNNLRFPVLEKLKLNSFFLFLFLFQFVFIFQGLDMGDEGFHSTFYQRIFTDPSSVQYNFMFWLSGMIGGAWLKLFPSYGLLGLRLGGVLINMLTIVITYRLLRNYIRDNYLKIGLLLLVLLNGAAVKDLSYNNLSALFFVCSISFLFKGIQKERYADLIVSGLFLTFATFCRLSNVSGLALSGVIVYSGFFVFRKTILYQLKQVVFFVGGFITGVLIMLGVMKAMGHYQVFLGSLEMLKTIAASTENTHGLENLIKILARDYSTALLKRFLPLAILVVLGSALLNYFKSNQSIRKLLPTAFALVFILFLVANIFYRGSLVVWIFLILLFSALSLIACFCLVIRKDNNELRIISLAGTIMTFALIAGSDYGIRASGSSALWIALPVATDFFLRISGFSVRLPGLTRTSNPFPLQVSDQQLQTVWKWGIYACVILLIFHSLIYTYNDNPNRLKMNTSVDNPFLKGVFTTPERASAVNGLLEESAKYLKPDDYVIAYADIPMFYTLTKTRPYIKNSWLGIYDKTLLGNELNKALILNRQLPPIVYQKVKTLPGPYWPLQNPEDAEFLLSNGKNLPVRKFIEENKYTMVWENNAFQIYTAPTTSKRNEP